MPELKPLPGSIGLDDVMEAVDYHAKACVDRAAGGKVDTASTRLKLSLLIAHYAENRRTPPEQPAAPSVAPEPLHVDETKRYRVVQKGYWWRVQIGDGQQTVGRCFSQTEAQHLAHALVVAYRDGFFVASLSAHPPRAPLTSGSIAQLYEDLQTAVAGHDTPLEMFTFLARSVEAAHGIGGK